MSGVPSETEIDNLILSFAQVQWRKVAMIIGKVMRESARRGAAADDYFIAQRIYALVERRQLESQGTLWMWRRSEVKLPSEV